MTSEQIQNYTRKITESSPTGIIVILYELAIGYLEDAKSAKANVGHEGFLKECLNAQKVLGDLVGALDFDYELALPLYRIYEYVEKSISDAIFKDDADKLDISIKYLSMLKDSFEKIAKEDKSGPAMDNAQTVYAGLTYGKGTLNESVDMGSRQRGYTV